MVKYSLCLCILNEIICGGLFISHLITCVQYRGDEADEILNLSELLSYKNTHQPRKSTDWEDTRAD